jgi:hypothetical protein
MMVPVELAAAVRSSCSGHGVHAGWRRRERWSVEWEGGRKGEALNEGVGESLPLGLGRCKIRLALLEEKTCVHAHGIIVLVRARQLLFYT